MSRFEFQTSTPPLYEAMMALHWAECLTVMRDPEAVSRAHRQVSRHFDTQQVSELTCIISTINAWNRCRFHRNPDKLGLFGGT